MGEPIPQISPSYNEPEVVSIPTSVRPPSPGVSTISITSSGGPGLNSVSAQGFSIPSKWRPSIMDAIEDKQLTPDVRNEVVRDLVTHMYGFMLKPNSSFCQYCAQRLILKYPFMRDSVGTGYVSVTIDGVASMIAACNNLL